MAGRLYRSLHTMSALSVCIVCCRCVSHALALHCLLFLLLVNSDSSASLSASLYVSECLSASHRPPKPFTDKFPNVPLHTLHTAFSANEQIIPRMTTPNPKKFYVGKSTITGPLHINLRFAFQKHASNWPHKHDQLNHGTTLCCFVGVMVVAKLQ